MAADVLEVAKAFGRDLDSAGESMKAKLVGELVREVEAHRAKAEAPADLEPLKVAIEEAGNAESKARRVIYWTGHPSFGWSLSYRSKMLATIEPLPALCGRVFVHDKLGGWEFFDGGSPAEIANACAERLAQLGLLVGLHVNSNVFHGGDVVTSNDGGPITAADVLQHSGASSVVGHLVLTRDNGRPGSGWEAGAVEARKWSVTGVVTDYTDGHGLGFKVKHDDGSEAWYEPEHLVLRARKEPLRSCLDVIRECGARAVLRKFVADRYAVGRMRGVVQRITEHHEAGTTRLECHVVHDDGSSWTRDAGELVVLGPLP